MKNLCTALALAILASCSPDAPGPKATAPSDLKIQKPGPAHEDSDALPIAPPALVVETPLNKIKEVSSYPELAKGLEKSGLDDYLSRIGGVLISYNDMQMGDKNGRLLNVRMVNRKNQEFSFNIFGPKADVEYVKRTIDAKSENGPACKSYSIISLVDAPANTFFYRTNEFWLLKQMEVYAPPGNTEPGYTFRDWKLR